MATIIIKFAYNEPCFGEIEVTGPNLEHEFDLDKELTLDKQSEEFTQNIMDKIIDSYPEAIDVELTNLEYFE